MIIFKQPSAIQSFLSTQRQAQVTIGFIPTMGALHSGHISLIEKARNENQLVICSIFVNPTQFNDPRDFEKYPSTIEQDIYQLEKSGCNILFLPSVKSIYPNGTKIRQHYELGVLETVLEGKYRPGHFQGVCQVVHRLLDIILPGKLYLGQKDFQQCMVIKKLIEMEHFNTQLVICPTQREPDGLAMSSRNLRLNKEERIKATGIYEALFIIKNEFKTTDFNALKDKAKNRLNEAGFKVDYVEIADAFNLRIEEKFDTNKTFVALAAAYLNEIRLIDNIILNGL